MGSVQRYVRSSSHSFGMRLFAFLAMLLPLWAPACTAFILHNGGRTFVGNNEDSW